MKAMVSQVDYDTKHNIVFIEDLANHTGSVTITNDAEHVADWFRAVYGNRIRIVYRDTDNEWWEIKWSLELDRGTVVTFKQWHGLEWDILSRKE